MAEKKPHKVCGRGCERCNRSKKGCVVQPGNIGCDRCMALGVECSGRKAPMRIPGAGVGSRGELGAKSVGGKGGAKGGEVGRGRGRPSKFGDTPTPPRLFTTENIFAPRTDFPRTITLNSAILASPHTIIAPFMNSLATTAPEKSRDLVLHPIKCCRNIKTATATKDQYDRELCTAFQSLDGNTDQVEVLDSEVGGMYWDSFGSVVRVLSMHHEPDPNLSTCEAHYYGITIDALGGSIVKEIKAERQLEVVTGVDSLQMEEQCLIRKSGGMELTCIHHPKRQYIVYEVTWQKRRTREDIRNAMVLEAKSISNKYYWQAMAIVGSSAFR